MRHSIYPIKNENKEKIDKRNIRNEFYSFLLHHIFVLWGLVGLVSRSFGGMQV